MYLSANSLLFRGLLPISQAEGRRFEPGLALQLFVLRNHERLRVPRILQAFRHNLVDSHWVVDPLDLDLTAILARDLVLD